MVDDRKADEVRVRLWIPPAPEYDSGWQAIPPLPLKLQHELGGDPDDYVVYLEAKHAGFGVTGLFYGWDLLHAGTEQGFEWERLTDEEILVYTGPQSQIEQVRVRIWRNPSPDFDSDWTGLEPATPETLAHGLGGDPDAYIIDLQFSRTPFVSRHQFGYGGDRSFEPGEEWDSYGAFWYGLTDEEIWVWRETEDTFVDRARLRIWDTGDCYDLVVEIDPPGSGGVTIEPPPNCDHGRGYLAFTVIELTATPGAAYDFDHWSTAYGGTLAGNPQRLAVDGDSTITAHFKPGGACYTLDLNFDCLRAGCWIMVTPPNCPDGERYLAGTVVELTAAGNNATYVFDHWSGDATGSANPTHVTMDADKEVTGHWLWIGPCYTLDLSVAPPGAGQATANKPPDCDGRPGYPEGDRVRLTAEPKPGYVFDFWLDHAGDRFFENPLWWTMSEDANVVAHFESTGAKKKVLFDEAHGERNTLDWDRAVELSNTLPWHPEPGWQLFGDLQAVLADEFTLERNASAPLTPGLLGGYEALILAAPESALSPAEQGAVGAFLREGGGLIILGDCGLEQPDDPLWATVYDLDFEGACLFAPVPQAVGDIAVTNFANHDAARGLGGFATNWGGSVWTTDRAARLAWTGEDAWEDTDGSGDYSAKDVTGVFPIIAGYDAGCGRVAGISDNAFQDEGNYGQDNEPVMRQLLEWVTGGQACPLDERSYLPLALR
jgi:hypothetical protein